MSDRVRITPWGEAFEEKAWPELIEANPDVARFPIYVPEAELTKLREVLALTQKPLNSAHDAARVIQAVKDGSWEGGDYFDQLRALRHDLFCGQILAKVDEVLK